MAEHDLSIAIIAIDGNTSTAIRNLEGDKNQLQVVLGNTKSIQLIYQLTKLMAGLAHRPDTGLHKRRNRCLEDDRNGDWHQVFRPSRIRDEETLNEALKLTQIRCSRLNSNTPIDRRNTRESNA